MKTPLLLSSSLLAGLLLALPAAPASAQEPVAPPPAAPPPAAAPPQNNAPITSMGDGAIGIGAVEWLSNVANVGHLTGGQFVYDQPMFHLEGVLGFSHVSVNGGSGTDFDFGVAGWYHLAHGTNADFSIGGGAGILYTTATGTNSQTAFTLEPGAEARVFLTPNFDLSARVGFALSFGDNNQPTTISLGGQTTAAIGFTYFFR